MSTNGMGDAAAAERLSALIDGELDAGDARSVCDHWKRDADCRGAWHAYQLIGDVLRSDDLASTASRDEAFLLTLRARLAVEPVVLAPSVAAGANDAIVAARMRRRPSRWALPSAMAAGVVVVAGTFAMLRPGVVPSTGAADVALGDTSAVQGGVSRVSQTTMSVPVEASTVLLNGRMVRDARLDRYLAAHKQFAGTSALGVPSAFLRSATVDAEAR